MFQIYRIQGKCEPTKKPTGHQPVGFKKNGIYPLSSLNSSCQLGFALGDVGQGVGEDVDGRLDFTQAYLFVQHLEEVILFQAGGEN